jgi:hypothetical protein
MTEMPLLEIAARVNESEIFELERNLESLAIAVACASTPAQLREALDELRSAVDDALAELDGPAAPEAA